LALTSGTRLGVYEVTAQIGEGGMGQVYRALDTKLKRQVAIKILPPSLAADRERLARFQREAEVLALLNHPHIAAIYGLEESGGITALVMELVEGEDLSQRIARSAIPLEEALPIAKQMAEALEAAHELGIIHRDLKPANIRVRSDGTVKVLDFGLAKTMEVVAGRDFSQSPTITTPAMTQAGMILGTAAYMSPEQARGKTVDKRADIWAFGAVLFEMITGKRAFPGDDLTDTLAAVVKLDPPWDAISEDVPARVRQVLRVCLQKDPGQRAQAIGDVRLALEGAFETVASVTPTVSPVAWRTRERAAWAASLVVVSLVGLALGAFAFRRQAPADVRAVRFLVFPPDGWSVTTGTPDGPLLAPLAVSPDGSRIAFVGTATTGGSRRLWVRELSTLSAKELRGTEGASSPFWSPDGQSLGFFADGQLKRIAVASGSAVTLCGGVTAPGGGTWSRDGVIVFAPSATLALQKVSASGGVPSAATVRGDGELGHRRPSFLPDGRHFLYSVVDGAIYLASLDSTDRTLLTKIPTNGNVLYADGHLLFVRDTTLMAQPFDLRQLTLTGEPVPVAEQVQVTRQYGAFSVSDAGVLVYQTGTGLATDRQLTWFDRVGQRLGTIEKPGSYVAVAISPDGTRVAMDRSEPGQPDNAEDVWVHDFARSTSMRFTFDRADDFMAVWSPDGSHLAWSTKRDGQYNLYRKGSNGAGLDQALFKSSDNKVPDDYSPDGRFLLYGVEAAGGFELWLLPLTGDDKKPKPYLQQDGFNVTQARFSPDGRFVAYTSNASGRPEVYVQPFPEPASGKWMVSREGGIQPRWRRDGRELFYISADSKVMAVPVSTVPNFTPSAPIALFAVPIFGGGTTTRSDTRYDVTSDGQKFLINAVLPGTTAARPVPPAPITVVLNWTAGLKR